MPNNTPSTSGGKKVSFSRQQHNFVLDSQKNEMYGLDKYLVGRLNDYSDDLSKLRYLDMIKLDMPNLLKLHVPKEDAQLLLYCFAYLKTITEFLDDLKKKIKKNTKVDKFVDELHDMFTVPRSMFIGYNQKQLMDVLRLIYDNLEIVHYRVANSPERKFYEICKACEENRSFLPEYKFQLRFWCDIVSGKPRHVPTPTVAAGKSILKKPRGN